MKRCPHCGREYDLSMSFCLDDGTELLYGPSSIDEPTTAVLPEPALPSEADTRAQVGLTDPTTVFPTEEKRKTRSRWFYGALIGIPIILIAAGAFAYYRFSSEKSPRVS